MSVPSTDHELPLELFRNRPALAPELLQTLTAETYEFKSAFAREHYGQGRAAGEAAGRAAGEAEMILVVLSARGLSVPDDVRVRISSCTDLDQLKVWGRRAATVASVEELFD